MQRKKEHATSYLFVFMHAGRYYVYCACTECAIQEWFHTNILQEYVTVGLIDNILLHMHVDLPGQDAADVTSECNL